MKVIILSQFAGSRIHGMVIRNYQWARELIDQGHEVTIMAASYAHPRVSQPDVKENEQVENIDGIRYIWIKGLSYYNPANFIARIMAIFAFTLKSYFALRRDKTKYDVVVASSPQPLVIYPAKYIADKNNAKLVFDIRDLWPLSLTELSRATSKNPFIKLIQHAEDYACKHADVVATVPGQCEGYLKSRGLVDGKFIHIPNGIGQDDLLIDQKSSALPETHKVILRTIKNDGNFIVGYAGALGTANALDTLIRAVNAARDESIHLVFVGKGPELNNLKNLVVTLNIKEQVHFLDPIAKDQVPNFLNNIDCGYCGLQKKGLFQYGVSPTKLNDYMLAEKPILYAVGDPNNSIEKSGSGISCEAENVDEIAQALNKFQSMKDSELKIMGQNGKAWLLENNMVGGHMTRLMKKLFPDEI